MFVFCYYTVMPKDKNIDLKAVSLRLSFSEPYRRIAKDLSVNPEYLRSKMKKNVFLLKIPIKRGYGEEFYIKLHKEITAIYKGILAK